MREHITQIVTAYWQGRLPALLNTLSDAGRRLGDLLALEDYYRTAYKDQDRLGKSLGSFASDTLDLKALSSVLQQSHASRGVERRRYQHLQGLARELGEVRKRFAAQPPAVGLHEAELGATKLLERFEAHIKPLSDALRLVRLARLESLGRYNPAEHDALYNHFNWRQLDSAEMALCPPFVVFAEPDAHRGSLLGEVIALAASGRPVKLVLLHSSWHPEHEETGRAAALQGMDDVSLLFLGLRNVYFLQTSAAAPTPIDERITQGLDSPRPAVLSIYAQGAGEPGFAERAALALASRAFPHFSYDPDRSMDFVGCLDLSDNPQPEAAWIEAPLVYEDDDGERSELTRPLTFADYAAGEPEFEAQFKLLAPDQAAHASPLIDYLDLPPAQRWNRVPVVQALGADKRLRKLVPSSAMQAHTTDRMHLWNTLQELAGIHNPFVLAAERRLRETLEAEKQAALDQQRTQLEAQHAASQQEQVSAAMRTLAQRLTGMTVSGAVPAPESAAPAPAAGPSAAPAATAAPAAPAPAAPAPSAPEGTGPWIDQRLCTSCDECIAINKALFSYNGTKKAVIKDPKAGPYKDLVRAAEKCSSGAIHPGLPLEPGEKDAEKWIKRAGPFQ